MPSQSPFHVTNRSCSVNIGDRAVVGRNVVLGPNCKRIEIGYGCFIARDIYIDVEELTIGDYTTIHHGSIIHGIRTTIGHNCWIGHYTIIDSLGGNTVLGNNVGVGAHSQLWSHMKFGDTLLGCKWNSSGSLILEDDVWLVGHCILAPLRAKKMAMLMTGSVATKDLEENQIYAGTPARNVSERLGAQFEIVSIKERHRRFELIKDAFEKETGIDSSQFAGVAHFSGRNDVIEFNLNDRTYLPRRTEAEYKFMRFMLYDKAKFTPISV